VWASVEKSSQAVTAEVFDEGHRRDLKMPAPLGGAGEWGP
jgi:hypothetical protein